MGDEVKVLKTSYNITADSTPDYDDWGMDDYWSLADWVEWHKQLRNKYSSDNKEAKTEIDGTYYLIKWNTKADQIWLDAWKKQSFNAAPINEMMKVGTSDFAYLKANIFLYMGTTAVLYDFNPYNPYAVVENIIKPMGEAITGVVSGVKTALKVLPIVAGVGIGIGVLILVAYLYKSFNNQKIIMQK